MYRQKQMDSSDIFDRQESDADSSDVPDDEYIVEKIMNDDFRTDSQEWFYLVKWKGYEECTWEPARNMTNCEQMIREWRTKKREKIQKKLDGSNDDSFIVDEHDGMPSRSNRTQPRREKSQESSVRASKKEKKRPVKESEKKKKRTEKLRNKTVANTGPRQQPPKSHLPPTRTESSTDDSSDDHFGGNIHRALSRLREKRQERANQLQTMSRSASTERKSAIDKSEDEGEAGNSSVPQKKLNLNGDSSSSTETDKADERGLMRHQNEPPDFDFAGGTPTFDEAAKEATAGKEGGDRPVTVERPLTAETAAEAGAQRQQKLAKNRKRTVVVGEDIEDENGKPGEKAKVSVGKKSTKTALTNKKPEGKDRQSKSGKSCNFSLSDVADDVWAAYGLPKGAQSLRRKSVAREPEDSAEYEPMQPVDPDKELLDDGVTAKVLTNGSDNGFDRDWEVESVLGLYVEDAPDGGEQCFVKFVGFKHPQLLPVTLVKQKALHAWLHWCDWECARQRKPLSGAYWGRQLAEPPSWMSPESLKAFKRWKMAKCGGDWKWDEGGNALGERCFVVDKCADGAVDTRKKNGP